MTTREFLAPTATALITAAAVALFAGAGERVDPAPGNVAYHGQFVFTRLEYNMGLGRSGGGGFFRRDLPWAHDYPRAERNLTKILDEVTYANPFQGPNGGNILKLDDPELHRFPFAYMSEPGYWTMTEAEVQGLRAYLQKGGFLVFDDFRGDHWHNFETQLRRVLPDARLVEMSAAHPVFHSFFDIDSLVMQPMYPPLTPLFYGVFEDNDPDNRLMIIANFNNDIGEYWEYSDTGWVPIDLSNEAYKYGVNYVMYSMTH